MRHRGTLVVVVALALFAAACSSDGGSSSGGGGGGGETTSDGGGGAGGAGGGGTTIVAQNFAFSPDTITVSAGKVTLTVSNKDSTTHTFTLDDDSSNTTLDAGSTHKITLDVTKTVGWHCSIHPTMTGTIQVS